MFWQNIVMTASWIRNYSVTGCIGSRSWSSNWHTVRMTSEEATFRIAIMTCGTETERN